MVEQENTVAVLSKKLVRVLDELLLGGNWEASLFLKTMATHLRHLRQQGEQLSHSRGSAYNNVSNIAQQEIKRKQAPAGYVQLFILLSQVNGADLSAWYRAIQALSADNVASPVYTVEEHAQGVIRTKVTEMAQHGYVVVNIKNTDIYCAAQPADPQGYPLCLLKE